jgi:hypothetical protein
VRRRMRAFSVRRLAVSCVVLCHDGSIAREGENEK